MRIFGFIVFIPASMLLTASFFVLFAIEKVKEKGLKTFGKLVAAILIIVSALIFAKGIYTVATGKCPIMEAMCPMGKGMGHMGMEKGMSGGMQGCGMPGGK
jgi:hypothetical protein